MALQSAAPGDTVLIYPGLYAETILVGKDNLRIVGSGLVTIDNEYGTGIAADVITVPAQGVSLTNLTIRNGGAKGIVVSGQGFVMTSVRVVGSESDCVNLSDTASGASIKASELRACGGNGITLGPGGLTKVNNLAIVGTKVGPTNGYGLYGGGDGLSVTGSTFHETFQGGVFLDNGDGSIVRKNAFLNSGSAAVMFFYGPLGDHHDTTVSYNTITGGGGSGIFIYGDNSVVTYNTLANLGFNAIHIYGATALVKGNTISGIDGDGIFIETGSSTVDTPIVTYNNISSTPGANGIHVAQNNATVSNNTITNAGYGLFVHGDSYKITANVITNVEYTGIDALGGSSGGLIEGNRVANIVGDYDGIDVVGTYTEPNPTTLLNNNVTHVGHDCFYLSGWEIEAKGNRGSDCGSRYGHGFEISSQAILESNSITRAAGDGFHLNPNSDALLTSNRADHCAEDGFDIHGSSVQLQGNYAAHNTGVGFEVDAAAGASFVQFLGGNVATVGNALGLCNAGSIATLTNTDHFGTTLAPSACDATSGFIGN